MVNLMEFKKTEGALAAHNAYARIIVPNLLQRGSYPLFASNVLTTILDAGEGTDFTQQVGIVRYRSRRDFMEFVLCPEMLAGVHFKWESLERTVVAASLGVMVMDGRLVGPLVFWIVAGLMTRMVGKRGRQEDKARDGKKEK